ncbi:MAG TPA: hypothetical protein VHF07_04965 [Nitrospiraceae bacterium]|nr:hypothetical protein [Nitrospiraceae bacterium]
MTKDSTTAHVHPHWLWHVLIATAVLLLGMAALLYHVRPAPRYLDPARQQLLTTLCLMTGVACLVPWILRRTLARDWQSTWMRHAHRTTPPVGELIPTLPRIWLQPVLWLTLALWITWVTWSLAIDDALAAALTIENGLLQDLTVVCYAAAAFLMFRSALKSLSRKALPNLRRWWLLLLALGCVGVAGEEINWGQSVVQYETPAFLTETNIQQEVSLHNLELPGLPGRHWSNEVLWGISLLGGVGIPISLLASTQLRRLAWITELPLPPWASQGYFLAAALIPRDGDMLGRLSRDNIPSELREVTIAVAMLIWAWSIWTRHPATPADRVDRTSQCGELDETRTLPASALPGRDRSSTR